MFNKPIAFVSPWYGEGISGGAEAELRGVVKHLQAAGVPLEVLSTCVKSFTDNWNVNYHKQGTTTEGGILVRRFKVRRRNTRAFDAVNYKLMQGQRLSPREEKVYCKEMINSPRLYDYMAKNKNRYALFVFIPDMFGTTYYGCQVEPSKSVLIPCFHDEPYAYMDCFHEAFSQVKGMVFNAEPERELAERLFNTEGQTNITMGIGVDTDWSCDAQQFRQKFGIDAPFVLYAGRKDEGKNVHTLIRYYEEYKRRHGDDLKLVLIGGGEVHNPDPQNIIDLGFVEVQDKYDAYAAASFLCNPSMNESFSLVIMESWLAQRPVLVHGKCPVTRDFAVRSNGGLYFQNYGEFEGCVTYLLEHESIATQMGQNGHAFVNQNFAWDSIVKKYIDYFESVVA